MVVVGLRYRTGHLIVRLRQWWTVVMRAGEATVAPWRSWWVEARPAPWLAHGVERKASATQPSRIPGPRSAGVAGTSLTHGHANVLRVLCLLLLFCAGVPAHASFGDCADPAYRARFDARFATSDYDCVEPLRVPVATGDGTRHIRLVHDLNADWILEPATMRDFERGVRASVEALGTLGRYSISDVTILLADDFPPPSGTETFGDIMAMANGAADSSECHVVLYLIGAGASREEAATTVAHEIFHCVQAATYSPGQYGAYRREGGAAWWVEGSAEWFASLALPDDSMHQSRVDSFDELSPHTPLHRMRYNALPFFLWYAQRHGNPALMLFLSGMADAPEEVEQLRAMEASMPADQWSQFAQDYFDRQIGRPHGTPLRFSPLQGDDWHWTASHVQSMRLQPFVITRSLIEIDCGVWTVAATPARAHGSRTSRATGGVWGPFPPRIDIAGGDPRRRLFVGFNATATPLALRIRIDQQTGCDACAGITGSDACLVGTWRETSGGAAQWMRDNLAHAVRVQADIARQRMTFDAAGNFSTEPTGGSFSLDGGEGRGEGAVSGVQSSGRWSAANGRLHLCPTTQAYDAQARLVTRGGQAVPIPLPPASAPQPRTMTYACDADTLTTQMPVPGMGPIRTTFGRSR